MNRRELIKKTFAAVLVVAVAIEGGHATGGAETMITDSSRYWRTNYWTGFSHPMSEADVLTWGGGVLIVYGGDGRGQTRQITNNSATVITVNQLWQVESR